MDSSWILHRTLHIPSFVGKDGSKGLRLCMLSCEENPPYGPPMSTGTLYLQLICNAIHASSDEFCANHGTDDIEMVDFNVSIEIYRAQFEMYPSDWSVYDGILIPGSFSSAYETQNWIERLKQVIQKEIHGQQRRTLAVCFGHQIFSHSFQEGLRTGLCIPCPSGHQAGRRSSTFSKEGMVLFSPQSDSHEKDGVDIELIYTHGDMVQQLPSCAVPLFGNDQVPIQAAAYFTNSEECDLFRKQCQLSSSSIMTKPYALTFQAHPEYSSYDGLEITFTNIMKAMEERKWLPVSEVEDAMKDTKLHFEELKKISISMIVQVGRIFGWFR